MWRRECASRVEAGIAAVRLQPRGQRCDLRAQAVARPCVTAVSLLMVVSKTVVMKGKAKEKRIHEGLKPVPRRPLLRHTCAYKHAHPHTRARICTYAPLHASVSFREWLQHRRLIHLPRVHEPFLQTESPPDSSQHVLFLEGANCITETWGISKRASLRTQSIHRSIDRSIHRVLLSTATLISQSLRHHTTSILSRPAMVLSRVPLVRIDIAFSFGAHPARQSCHTAPSTAPIP